MTGFEPATQTGKDFKSFALTTRPQCLLWKYKNTLRGNRTPGFRMEIWNVTTTPLEFYKRDLVYLNRTGDHSISDLPLQSNALPTELRRAMKTIICSLHAGLNRGPFVYKTNALPLSHKGLPILNLLVIKLLIIYLYILI